MLNLVEPRRSGAMLDEALQMTQRDAGVEKHTR